MPHRLSLAIIAVVAAPGACGGDQAPASADSGDAIGEVDDAAAEVAATTHLVVSPATVDLETVPRGQSKTATALLLNVGLTPATVTRLVFAGHVAFTATIDGVDYGITADSASAGIAPTAPLVIEAGTSVPIEVHYLASGPEAAQGDLIFFEDDADRGVDLKMYANLRGACIKTVPERLSFGGRLVGVAATSLLEIESCGDVDLEIDSIGVTGGGGGLFTADIGQAGVLPLRVPPGSPVYLPVSYTPTTLAALDANGQLVQDTGAIEIRSNAYLATLDVPVDGFGADCECASAVITVAEGEEVLPQTVLHLDGTGSSACNGGATGYEWSVVQPAGSVSTFAPSPYVANPTFEADVVGTYVFRLVVRDAFGTQSCTAAEYTVTVTSDDAIHIELLWDTPGDLNQQDTGGDQIYFSVGSDLDLHLLRVAPGATWFDPAWDCYAQDPAPEWGNASTADNPRLDRDDTDGAGPENINVEVPEQDARFEVGVYYENDWGYGDSFATVRIYIYGVLRDEWSRVELVKHDLWDAETIAWPSGQVTRVGSAPRITHDFQH